MIRGAFRYFYNHARLPVSTSFRDLDHSDYGHSSSLDTPVQSLLKANNPPNTKRTGLVGVAETIAYWFREIGLAEFAHHFTQQSIDLERLCALSDKDLQNLGVESVGQRNRILAAIIDLQNSLIVQLDQLGAAREVAQLAAVIGRSFSTLLLAAVSPRDPDELLSGLDALVEAELIYATAGYPQTVYTFKQPLLREIAYNSLSLDEQQEWHARIATVLERQHQDGRFSEPTVVANHPARAGNATKAIEDWRVATESALHQSDYAQAVEHTNASLDQIH